MINRQDLEKVISKIRSKEYKTYFYLPDFEKHSGGIRLVYRTVKLLNDMGFNAVILHTKHGFKLDWLDNDLKNVPISYLTDDHGDHIQLEVHMEDTFIIPEGFADVMEQTREMPAKRFVLCQNWYYVLNSLQPGVYWDSYGIFDCISVSKKQTDYLKAIMPFLRIKDLQPGVDQEFYHKPESKCDKVPIVAFVPTRDGGLKGVSVIKHFYALHKNLRWIQFRELKDMSNDEYAKTMRECAFFLHMDETSSWGTAPIEAFNSGTLVAAWDGYGGREYMNDNNTYLAVNGNIFDLARKLGDMINEYLTDSISNSRWLAMKEAADIYSQQRETDSIRKIFTEIEDDRIKEMNELASTLKEDK